MSETNFIVNFSLSVPLCAEVGEGWFRTYALPPFALLRQSTQTAYANYKWVQVLHTKDHAGGTGVYFYETRDSCMYWNTGRTKAGKNKLDVFLKLKDEYCANFPFNPNLCSEDFDLDGIVKQPRRASYQLLRTLSSTSVWATRQDKMYTASLQLDRQVATLAVLLAYDSVQFVEQYELCGPIFTMELVDVRNLEKQHGEVLLPDSWDLREQEKWKLEHQLQKLDVRGADGTACHFATRMIACPGSWSEFADKNWSL